MKNEPYRSRDRSPSPRSRQERELFPRHKRNNHSVSLSPNQSDEDEHHGPLCRAIMDIPIPSDLVKIPRLGQYDNTTDPDEHIENIDALLDYHGVHEAIKCRLFPT